MEVSRTGFDTTEEPHPTKLVNGGVCISNTRGRLASVQNPRY